MPAATRFSRGGCRRSSTQRPAARWREWCGSGPAALAGLAQQRLQLRVSGAAYRQLGAVGEHGYTAVLGVGFNPCDAFQVHDIRAMNAHEALRIELCLNARDCLLLQVVLLLAPQRDVVVLRLDVIELVDRNNMDFGAVLYDDALQFLIRRPRRRRQIDRKSVV